MLPLSSGAADNIEEATPAVVVGMHSMESTKGFAAARGIPGGQRAGGRYAVVRLVDDAHHRRTYALVYVPPNVKIAKDDRVVIAGNGYDPVAEPGRGFVLGVAAQGTVQP